MTDDPQDPAFQAWCLRQYAMVREGGIWMVPRSGMVFQKRAGGFVLTAEMPWMPEMEGRITREQLREQQDEEFDVIRRHFAAVDIPVTRAEEVFSADPSST